MDWILRRLFILLLEYLNKKKIDIFNVYLVRCFVKRIKNMRYFLDKKLFLKRNIKFSYNECVFMECGDMKFFEGNFMVILLLF